MSANRAAKAASLQWWAPRDGVETHEVVSRVLGMLRTQHAGRRDAYEYYAKQYAGPHVGSLTALRAGIPSSPFTSNALSFNVVASVVNTVQAKIAKNRPLPKFVTNGGDWSQMRKAKKFSKFIEGEFDRCGIWELAPQLVLHACVFGQGVVKASEDGESINVELEFPWRVLVDEQESQYGMKYVRSYYQRKPIDRIVLAEMFPKHREFILHEASNDSDDVQEWDAESDVTADQIIVTECWHLKSGKKTKDGRRAVVIRGKTLLEEPYDKPRAPFFWLHRNDVLMGVHGIGFAEQLVGIQREINFVAKRIQEAHYRMGGSHWAVENSTKVKAEMLNNGHATVLRYTGAAPVPAHVPPFHPQTYQYLDGLIPKAYEMTGVSQLSASGRKPAGLDSGAALREYNDTESEGFVVFAKKFENFFKELAGGLVDLLRDLVEANPDYEVNVPGRRNRRGLKFAEVALEPDSYVIECFPTSMLTHTPAGRLAQVESLIKGGLISDTKEARRLLAFPDLEASNSRADASHELVESMIDAMLDDGVYESPEPYLDLVDALYTVQQAYLEARADKAPEEALDMLRDFLEATKDLLDKQMAEQAPPPDAAMGAPAGPPMPAEGAPLAAA